MRPFWLALGLLTRIPVPDLGEPRPGEQGRSMLYYPLVGLLIGIGMVLIALLLSATNTGVTAALLLLFWVMVTGALHLDGLADSADAWLGGHGDRERALAIMKDPASGPAGVTTMALVLLLKYAALSELVANDGLMGLLVVPILARALLPLLFLSTDYVRPGGMASAMAAELEQQPVIPVLAALSVTVVVLMAGDGIKLLLVALLVAWGLRHLMVSQLGGTTGDTAGAMVEIVEAAILLAAVIEV